MFKLAKKRTVHWPIRVEVPQDGGRTERQTFTGTFEIVDSDELQEHLKTGGSIPERVLVGWADDAVKDEHGEASIAFSEEAKRKLLKISYVRAAVIEAYSEASMGRAAAEKN